MKLLLVSALLFVIILNCSTAQWQRCHGQLWMGSCWFQGQQGHGGRGCRGYMVYYFDRNIRQCRPMFYQGCAGNSNRWCSRNACRQSCGGR